MKEKIIKARKIFKRLNQLVLVLPVWLVLGISGFFRGFPDKGWKTSDKNEEYKKMY